MDPLGSAALLEEALVCGRALRIYSYTLFPVHSVLPLCSSEVLSRLPVLATVRVCVSAVMDV